MKWENCLESGNAKPRKTDKNLAKSCIKMSENKISDAQILSKNKGSISGIFVLYYDAFLETCQAIVAVEGMKIYNHECITSFLKEYLEEDAISKTFDECRQLRNGINYYGEEIDKGLAERLIERILSSIKQLKNKHINI